jgi:two-component system, chemotaxis family, sensor kinase Cph1
MGITAPQIDLANCDLEPIHVPGSIQPYGMILVAEQDGHIVRHVAGAIEQRLGISDWEGRTLKALIGEPAVNIAALVQPGSVARLMGQLRTVK